MSNGMPSWEEWNGLTEDQRSYKQHEVLVTVTKHLSEQCPARVIACNNRISKLENRKKFDTAVAGSGGVIGGILARVGEWIMRG
jgi:hypothetical protein